MRKQEICQIAEELANTGYNISRENFLQQMRTMHPTVQQIFAGLILVWMQDYITYNVDGRNRHSVEYFTRIIETFKTANPDEPLRNGFPLI